MNDTSIDSSGQALSDDEINLLDLLEVLAKRWKMIVMVTFSAAIVSVVYSLLLPNVYTATARILPPQDEGGVGVSR
jgi:uncharacterized protein involved in exopolysaccharide biosynthesis